MRAIEVSGSNLRLPKPIINLEDHCSKNLTMDPRKRKPALNHNVPPLEKKKIEFYNRSFSQGSSRKLLPANYFSLESLLLLSCLTASLLILPLILPPLPPPPFLLLLVPIGILALLMVLAFMPGNIRDVTYTYM